jgi:hypothetical protein
VTGEVTLEQPGRLAAALALGYTAGDVVPGRGIVLAAVQHDRVQRPVELTIAAAAEPVSSSLPARGGDGCDAGEAGAAGFGAQSPRCDQATIS